MFELSKKYKYCKESLKEPLGNKNQLREFMLSHVSVNLKPHIIMLDDLKADKTYEKIKCRAMD